MVRGMSPRPSAFVGQVVAIDAGQDHVVQPPLRDCLPKRSFTMDY